MSPDSAAAVAWQLTRAISPQDRVRVASTDASGAVLNQYSRSWPLDRPEPPPVPWAVHLAGPDGFHLLAFDFDAKGDESAAAQDAAALADLLDQVGIGHLICRSGPSGGRHVWVATLEAVHADLVGTLARLAAALLPNLDIAPLRNPATGCVRPPGAPHRDGGRSAVLHGDPHCLLQPTTTSSQITALVQLLSAQVNAPSDTPHSPTASIHLDSDGHPYLPGPRRPLPAASRTALDTGTDGLDASTVLNTVLLGAAASHWHLTDIVDLIQSAPGLEYLRSRRGTRGRTDRLPRDRTQTLARHWKYAVRYIADNPRRTGADETFDTRAGDSADLIRTLQERADSTPGRWTRGGGPSDRRVLDCLHLWALTALTSVLEADTRRIATTCGIGRETARTALLRLAADGWIACIENATGVHGATWHIDPHRILHRSPETARAQAATRPEGAGAAERTVVLKHLSHRLVLANHDVFTGPHALSLAAGNLYARLACRPQAGPHATEDRQLQQLQQAGLVERRADGWSAIRHAILDGVARRLGVDGRLTDRRRRYDAERAAWRWWQAERTWMCEPHTRRDRRPRYDQVPLWQSSAGNRYPKHPRGPNGRASFSAARRAITQGALDAVALAA